MSVFCVLAALLASGCTYFRLPVLQGNIVDYEKAEKLELGMTPSQVEFLLGTPLIQDSFGSPRWDYVVYYRSPKADTLQRNLSISFENDRVSRIEGMEELLADWRRQKALVEQVRQASETPQPGQMPVNASASPADPTATDEPHPVLPPSDPQLREELEKDDEETESEAEAEPVSEAEPVEQEATTPATAGSDDANESDNYPPDMTRIYRK